MGAAGPVRRTGVVIKSLNKVYQLYMMRAYYDMIQLIKLCNLFQNHVGPFSGELTPAKGPDSDPTLLQTQHFTSRSELKATPSPTLPELFGEDHHDNPNQQLISSSR